MDAARAIDRYETMSPKIFRRGTLAPLGSSKIKGFFGKAQFKAKALEDAIKDVIIECLPDGEKNIPGIDVGEATLVPPVLEQEDTLVARKDQGPCKM
jgi:hypothetical protein